jgi:hypothetical protein
MENVVAFEIARAALEKFGGDSADETVGNFRRFLKIARSLPLDPPLMTLASGEVPGAM